VGIVGGSGYVGSSLVKHLGRFFEVKVLDTAPLTEGLHQNVEHANCDIRKYDDVVEGLRDTDVVIHTAIVQIPRINEERWLGYQVNVLGTQNICRAVEACDTIKGMIVAGSWHVIGESGLRGVVDEGFGFRPDKVEDRARLYVLSKIAQESIVRLYDEASCKPYGVIRLGTVLGEGMPKQTAANLFIENALCGKAITPFKHSMYRPMLYVDIEDICKAFSVFAAKILSGSIEKRKNSLDHIVNVYYPKPVTVLELAEIVSRAVAKHSEGRLKPKIDVVDMGHPSPFNESSSLQIEVNAGKASDFLGLSELVSPEDSVERIVAKRIKSLL